MKIYQNAGFSNPLSTPGRDVNGFGAAVQATSHGIRSGPANNDGHERIRPMCVDALRWGDSAIMIVAGWDWRDESKPIHSPGHMYSDRNRKPDVEHTANQAEQVIHDWRFGGGLDGNLTIEIAGELDLTDIWKGRKLSGYYDFAMRVYDRVRSLSSEVKIVTGSTSNFRQRPRFKRSRRGFEVLECLHDMGFPKDTLQGVHPYRNDLPPGLYHNWDRQGAFNVLRGLLDGRKIAITEMGWHSRGDWTNQQIAGFVRDEINSWREFGADCYVHYQIQDGRKPNNTGEGGFGAFENHEDGLTPKPVATVLREERNKGEV